MIVAAFSSAPQAFLMSSSGSPSAPAKTIASGVFGFLISRHVASVVAASRVQRDVSGLPGLRFVAAHRQP